MKQIIPNGSTGRASVLSVKDGGTGVDTRDGIVHDFNLVDLAKLDTAGYPGRLTKYKTIPTNQIPTDIKVRPSVNGPLEVYTGTTSKHYITDYDYNQKYTVVAIGGTISIDRDEITYIAPSTNGSNVVGGFYLNDQRYDVDVEGVSINKPVITSPAQNTVNLDPVSITIEANGFSVTGLTDTHASSDWQISTKSDFSVITAEVVGSTTSKTSYTTTSLTYGTQYYVRVRYKGINYGVSSWSDALVMSTKIRPYVEAPMITAPIANATNTRTVLTFASSPFSVYTDTDTQVSSDWQISTSSDFSTLAYSVSGSSTYKTNWINTVLSYTTYYVRVRYTGSKWGTSAWSDPVKFTTGANPSINKPEITSPPSGMVGMGLSVMFKATAFATSDGDDIYSLTEWQLATNTNFTTLIASSNNATNVRSWTVPGLSSYTTYYARMRFKGTTWGYSPWSTVASFTTMLVPKVVTPSIASPSMSNIGTNTSLTVTGTAFTMESGNDTHASSDWQIALDAGFISLLASVNASTAYKTSWSVSDLAFSTTYYVRVRYRNTYGTVSEWSPVGTFNTKSQPYIVTPSITNSPGTLHDTAYTLTSTAFSCANDTDTQTAAQWQLATDINFTNIVGINTVSGANASFGLSNLAWSTTYYARVRYIGTKWGFSAWSPIIEFSTSARPYIAAPVLTESTPGNIVGSAFNCVNGSDTHIATEWKKVSGFRFTDLQELDDVSTTKLTSRGFEIPFQSYHTVFARYKGASFGYSEWSKGVTLTATGSGSGY